MLSAVMQCVEWVVLFYLLEQEHCNYKKYLVKFGTLNILKFGFLVQHSFSALLLSCTDVTHP